MLVSTILEAKGDTVATIPRTATLGDAVAELVRHRVGALVVSPGDGIIEGILSERDVVRCLSELRADVLGQPVHAVMSSQVHLCSPDDTVDVDHEPDDRGTDPPCARGGRRAAVAASSASATS